MNAYLESLSRQAGLTAVTDIGHQSVEEFYRQARENLTYQEACTLHEASQQALKRNRMYEASLLAHAAPWLPSALQVGMRVGQDTRDYDGEFGDRSSRYTVPGSVSSMFSPAAYLTELYSQARDLHPAKSTYHLDVRRPDLKELILSQENLDAEVTVLSLSNEWLLRKAQEVVEGGDGTPQEVLNFLSKLRTTGVTPHHDAFERLHHGLLAKDPGFKHWHTYAGVTDLMEPVARRALRSNIDPELRQLLLEEITDPDTIDAVYALNFNKISPAQFLEPDHLKRYYELSDEEVAYCLEFVPPDTEPSLPPLMEWFQRNRTKCIQFLINEVRYEIGIKMGYGALGELILEPQSSPGTYQCRFRSYIPEDRLTVRKSELLLHWSDGSESAAILLSDDWRDFLYSNRWYESSLTLDIRPYTGRVNRASIRITETNGAVRSLAETELFTLNEVSLSDLVQIDKYRALALNRLIRLSRASGLDLRVAVTAVDRYLPSAVNSIEWEARYAISPEERLVLDGAEIPTRAPTGTPSLFDQLFNTPPLNGVVLEPASEPPIVLDFRVADPRKDILKRAFVVDDTGLHLLAQLYFGVPDPTELKHNLATLSGLWRVCMVARVHGLSLPELAVLLLAMDEVNLGFENVLVDALAERIDRIHATCEWLKGQGWSVFDALARTTSAYDGQSTPEWSQLLSVLHATVESAKGADTVEQKVAVLAPHVAAGLLLPGARAGEVTLLWADRLPKPNDMTIEAFWEQVAQDPTDASAIAFVQVLAQLALIQQDVQLPVAALGSFVATPQTLYGAGSPRNVLGHDLETLQALARFAKWLQALGEHASSTLSAFLRGELTPALLAEAMQWEALRVQEAVVQAVAHDQVVDPAHLSSELELDRVMQWVRLSEVYGLAPSKLSQLLALRYDAGESSYAKWHEAAMAIATGLSPLQSAQVHGVVDEALSAALSAYVIQHVFPDLPLMDRNGLYQHVLLDNQSSAQVTTTRIAEAIASLQFYVNSAMAGLEGADRVVMQRQFFRDWQRYNQRYSSWAGAAKLGYYPENYIEPTLRIGQTDMMDALLAQIGQSQLTSDSVGDAFLSYLNSFEEVANLDVISGYHEQIDLEQGKTYFIGEDMTEPRRYYWRSLDQNKKQATGGYPANAWTEWRKIDGIALPFESCIRPVTFKSRLYLIWLERKDIATSTQAEALPNAESYTYQIKWAYLRHDGNWSTPYSHDVTSAMAGQGGGPFAHPVCR
ncbi:neuraminidase-like domain-containing protein [Luteibacter sp. SG786]|uniref:neuraminidase-like domain-containing protein n=1 Tax=Luteibacter sp. SG786 TaxID=2587130 RepID=UPI00141F8CE5|nr:neuraminidase-like domain-containing protein [Luteibacter sp. SG786]NII54895.1 hypothetical protein [Luteibacter sp. SG786]